MPLDAAEIWPMMTATSASTTKQVAPRHHAATCGLLCSRTPALTPHPAAMIRPTRATTMVAVMVSSLHDVEMPGMEAAPLPDENARKQLVILQPKGLNAHDESFQPEGNRIADEEHGNADDGQPAPAGERRCR